MLWDFIPRYNQRFGVPAAQPGSAYRQLPSGACLDAVLSFKYLRTVVNDNTVRFNGAAIQIMADAYRASYPRAHVEVQERLDGSTVVIYQDNTLAAEPAAPGPVTLRARNGRCSNGHLSVDRLAADSNGDHSRPAGAERRDGAKSLQGAEPLPTTNTNSPRKPAPNHPWIGRLLT